VVPVLGGGIPTTILLCGYKFFQVETIPQEYITLGGPGSVVGIATGYRLDGPGIEFWWGQEFFPCPDRIWGPPSLLYNGYWVFPRGKEQPGHDADPSFPSSAVGHKRVERLPLLLLWAVWPVQRLSVCTRVHFTFMPHWNVDALRILFLVNVATKPLSSQEVYSTILNVSWPCTDDSLWKTKPKSAYTNMSVCCSICSRTSCMFQPPVVAIFREVFFAGYITSNISRIYKCKMFSFK
jgi:hypothetical protein